MRRETQLAEVNRVEAGVYQTPNKRFMVRAIGQGDGRRWFIFRGQGRVAPSINVPGASGVDGVRDGYPMLRIARAAISILIWEDRSDARRARAPAIVPSHIARQLGIKRK